MKGILTFFALFFAQILIAQTTIIIDENFNDGQLDPAITFNPNLEGTNGRVEISNNIAIIGKHDDATGFTRNSIDIKLDLKDKSDIFLFFSIYDNFDENHAQDGLFLSNNGGIDFHKVYDFKPETWCNITWGNFPGFDIDRLAEKAGLPFTENFVLRIQQYDNADFFNNSFGADSDGLLIDNILVYSRIQNYARLPFEDNFNNAINGLFGDSWHIPFADWGRPELTQFVSPMSYVGINPSLGTNNSNALLLGKRANCDFGATVSAIDLRLNLEGESDVFMYFGLKEIYDETHDEDGLFFSNDGGITFKKVYHFKPETWCSNIWGAFPPFNIDRLAEAADMTLTDKFVIRFQQFDDADFANNSFGADSDGLFIDNIFVYSKKPVYATLPFEENFDNTINGQLGESLQAAHPDDVDPNLTEFIKPTSLSLIGIGGGVNQSDGYVLGKRDNCEDGSTVNALDVFLKLGGCSNVKLDFDFRQFNDEPHDQDGIFFSNDGGASFKKIYSYNLSTLPFNIWLNFSLSLDSLLQGETLTDNSIIRFQQFDDADFLNNSFGNETDGHVLDNIKVSCSSTSNIENIHENNSFQVYPNPVEDVLNISFAQQTDVREILIFNAQGKLSLRHKTQSAQIKTDISTLSQGIYAIQIITESGTTITQKFIKK